MPYAVKILTDSINDASVRLTTWELTYPRFVHAELMTHRVFSRNSASSRAIPVEKMMTNILADPAMFVWWGKNQAGMAAEQEIEDKEAARKWWLRGMHQAIAHAKDGLALGLHKQIVNRVTEPWMHITVILSATTFSNWFGLRCDKAAQPEIRHVAEQMRDLYETEKPLYVRDSEWHMPLVQYSDRVEAIERARASFAQEANDDYETVDLLNRAERDLIRISAGRCARVSYLTHDGRRDHLEDIALADRLVQSGHWSPFEHVAQNRNDRQQYGNFRGWKQYRKFFENEHRGERMP